MNFYKHHIGDYAQATAHLSFVEDAAYSRMIRKYYAEEKPLPADIKAVQRLIGARTRDEKQAVVDVLNEFFELQEDGWHNKRCDAEIERANAQAETNRQIAIQREARKKERIASNEPSTNRGQKMNESFNESFASREPSQTPDTRHQTPDTRHQTPDKEQIPTAGNSTTVGGGGISPGELTKPMVQAGIRCNPGHPDILALAKAGCTAETVQAAITEAKLTKPNPPQGYVVAILKRWQSEPARTLPKSQSPPGTVSSFGKAGQETAASAQRWLEKSGETG